MDMPEPGTYISHAEASARSTAKSINGTWRASAVVVYPSTLQHPTLSDANHRTQRALFFFVSPSESQAAWQLHVETNQPTYSGVLFDRQDPQAGCSCVAKPTNVRTRAFCLTVKIQHFRPRYKHAISYYGGP